jgi:hypothetical protein
MTSFTIKARDLHDVFNLALPFVETSGMVPAISCLHVTIQQARISVAATDRFRVGIGTLPMLGDTEAEPGAFYIDYRDARNVLSLFKPNRYDNPDLTLAVNDEGLLTIQALGGFGAVTSIRAVVPVQPAMNFPDIYKLVVESISPRENPAGVLSVNPKYLADFRHVQRDSVGLEVHIGPANKAIGLTCGDHFAGALMVRRLIGEREEAPDRAPLIEQLNHLSWTTSAKSQEAVA